ncbi:hypothetical protein WAI453_012698 [Rhynchosporium graminicola]
MRSAFVDFWPGIRWLSILPSLTLRYERIEGYAQMIQRATAGFEDRLERIDGRLEILEERANTEKYMQICTQLLEHINRLRLAGRLRPGSSQANETDCAPERIANEGLEAITSSGTSARDEVEISRLRREWESTLSVFQNRATGNAIQVMFSADGTRMRGTNEATGEWTRQASGHMSNETIQQVMRDMVQITLASCEVKKAKLSEKKAVAEEDGNTENSKDSKFRELYGEGYSLVCVSPTGSTTAESRLL